MSNSDYRFSLNELASGSTCLGSSWPRQCPVQLVPELTIPGARQVLGVVLAILATRAEWPCCAGAGGGHAPALASCPRHPNTGYLAAALRGRGRCARIGGSQGDHRVKFVTGRRSERSWAAGRSDEDAGLDLTPRCCWSPRVADAKDTQGADGHC